MKIIEPKYEILTDISEGGIKELQQIERVARVCYKSEDKITPDGESAKKLVGFLVKQGHEAMLEHSQLSVLFTCDRGVANELVRHRIASFAQESTRYCNYSKEKFEGSITKEDVLEHRECLLDPDNVICVSDRTHKAIHYGDDSILEPVFTERRPGDTCPWRK